MSKNSKTTRRAQRTQHPIPQGGPSPITADRMRLESLVNGIQAASKRSNEPFRVLSSGENFDLIEDQRWYLRLIPDIPPEDAVVLSYLLDLPDERRRAISTLLTQAHLFIGRGGRIGRDPFRPVAAVPTRAASTKRRNQRLLPAAL